jgi:cytoskeletal protein CcmA (bactofilin family)
MRIGLIIILSLMFLNSSYSAEYLTGNVVKVQVGDTVTSDIFSGARYVDVYGTVKGDVYAGCEALTVEGEIEDDLLAGCRNLQIRGNVKDVVIGFAQTIIIDGEVEGDVLAFGGSLRLTERAILKGNLLVWAGELIVDGASIAGDITGGSGKIYLNGPVAGKVDLDAESVNFGANYKANRGTKLTLTQELDREKIEYLPSDLEIIIKPPKRFYQSVVFYWWFIALLVLGAIIIALFKNFTSDYLTHSYINPAKALGIGVLTVIVTPIASLILMLLIFTIPIAMILLALYLILLCLSIVFSALFAGDYIFKLFKADGIKSLFWPLLVGLLIVVFIVKIPIIGFILNLIILSFGSGSLIVYIWDLLKPAESSIT